MRAAHARVARFVVATRCAMPLSSSELERFRTFAAELADLAGAAILPFFRNGSAVHNKDADGFDPVTEADRASERAMRARIEAAFPSHGVLGEEFGEQPGEDAFRWVLDPIDGTRAFISGLPTWTTLIALEYEGAPVLGLIDQPFTGERWIGAGEAAVRIGPQPEPKRLGVSGVTRLADAIVSTTDPRASAYFSAQEAAAFDAAAEAARLARFGLDAYAYAMVAEGCLDLVIESGLQIYDYSAHRPLIEAAGGVLTDWRGRPPAPGPGGGCQIVASASRALHEEALAVLAPAAA